MAGFSPKWPKMVILVKLVKMVNFDHFLSRTDQKVIVSLEFWWVGGLLTFSLTRKLIILTSKMGVFPALAEKATLFLVARAGQKYGGLLGKG